MTPNEELRQELESLGRDKLNVLAKDLGVRGFRKQNIDDLVQCILEAYESDKISRNLRRFASSTAWSRRIWWEKYHNHIYGIAGVIGVVLSVTFYFIPSSRDVSVDESLPIIIGMKTVDGFGNVLNNANTKKLEYVIWAPRKMPW